MNNIFKILTFLLVAMSLLVARGAETKSKSVISIKINPYYFDINNDGDLLYKKRSHKRRKIKRKPRRGRDNR